MNFNQISTGTLGSNACTIMQSHYYGCNENQILTRRWPSRREASSGCLRCDLGLPLPWERGCLGTAWTGGWSCGEGRSRQGCFLDRGSPGPRGQWTNRQPEGAGWADTAKPWCPQAPHILRFPFSTAPPGDIPSVLQKALVEHLRARLRGWSVSGAGM